MQQAELVALVRDRHAHPEVARRGQMILWESEGLAIGKIAALARVSRPTLNLWRTRYRQEGISGLTNRDRPGGQPQISPEVRSRILALTGCLPRRQGRSKII